MMNVLVLLAVILFALMAWIGGKKGVRSFIALFINFIIVLLAVFIMHDPSGNPIIIALIACGFISAVSLFFINQINNKTTLAFFATIVTMVVLIFAIIILTEQSMIYGLGEEEYGEITTFNVNIGLNFVQIATAVIIMSTIGAIVDTAISITSPMREIHDQNPTISRKDLFLAGIQIGRDILGTSTNTLFFAFFGGYMGLLIWFKDLEYSIGDIINAKVFNDELLTILISGVGIALVIPIASLMSAYYLKRKPKNVTAEKKNK